MSHEALVTQSGGEGLATRKDCRSRSCEAINEKLTPWDIVYAVNMALTCRISYAIITQVLVPFAD